MGAGCSLEAPTGLKIASYYAREGYRRLVANSSVPEEATLSDWDLAAVASHCVEHAGRDVLEELLPVERFRTAESNLGTQIAAALVREDIVRTVVTLNLDLSASNALSAMSSRGDVSVISRQDGQSHYGANNLVYLHGNVEEDPKYWVLTHEDLANAEGSGWHQLIATLTTATPVVLFAGMGSTANVFAESVEWIGEKLPSGSTSVYLASLDDGPVSKFATSLHIDADHYIKLGWCDLMAGIGARVCEEMISTLLQHATEVQREGEWPHAVVDCNRLVAPMLHLGLLGLGRVRALWLGEETKYLPQRFLPEQELNRFAELLVVSVAVAAHLQAIPMFSTRGAVNFGGQSAVLIRSGGRLTWTELEYRVRREYGSTPDAHLLPRKVILAHARNRPSDDRVPIDIIGGPGDPGDIAVGDSDVAFLSADDVLAEPGLAA
jgi:hypothetical protein